jgi:hypothetical protein
MTSRMAVSGIASASLIAVDISVRIRGWTSRENVANGAGHQAECGHET